ncbi:hypothetical protein TNCV_4308781 [Trichonephila clavipes]|nr:hypothetical protein TNCV_4308781 [Trichonephila clavipes]
MMRCLNKSVPPIHTLCYHHMSVYNKYRMGPKVWPYPHVYELVITETESGFNAEDHTPPVSHSPACSRSEKFLSTLLVM